MPYNDAEPGGSAWDSKRAQGITSNRPMDDGRETVVLADYGRGLLAAVDAVIERAQRTQASLHIAQLRSEGRAHDGGAEAALERIDRARARGADITCDAYPYVATWIELRELLPRGLDVTTLGDETIAAAAALEMDARLGDIWHDVILAEVSSEERAAWCGMRFDDIGAQMRLRPSRAVIEFARLDGERARAFYFCLSEDDVAMVLSADFTSVTCASPAFGFDDRRFGLVHPRAFGAFPRVIGRFVRGRKTLTLEEAIRRMSGPNELRADAPADLILFDEQQFVDTATYAQPVSAPRGLKHVWVDGILKEAR